MFSEVHNWLKNLAIYADAQYIKSIDPWMKSELYLERLHAIAYFSKFSNFDLYGNGWDKLKTINEKKISNEIMKSWRGNLSYLNKLSTLSNYKFYLCFENTVFPGYLTEKIFDCFFSGVIPIYLGDPEVSKRIPKNTFIDLRKFNTYEELNYFLQSLSISDANDYIDAAQSFIKSNEFQEFTANALAEKILNAVNEAYYQYI